MEPKKSHTSIKFEAGSKQPFIIFIIGVIIISALITILALAASGISLKNGENSSLGDVNNDGFVNSGDALYVLQYIVDNVEFDDKQAKNADVDLNKSVNSQDALLIVQFANGSSKDIGSLAQTTEKPISSTSQKSEEEDPDDPSTSSEPDKSSSEDNTQNFEKSGIAENAAYLTSEANIYFTARITNSWQGQNGKNMYQIEFKVKNNSEKTIYNTFADVSFSQNINVEKSWKCSTKSNGTASIKVTTQNEESVRAGGVFSCGFIVSCDSKALEVLSVSKN